MKSLIIVLCSLALLAPEVLAAKKAGKNSKASFSAAGGAVQVELGKAYTIPTSKVKRLKKFLKIKSKAKLKGYTTKTGDKILVGIGSRKNAWTQIQIQSELKSKSSFSSKAKPSKTTNDKYTRMEKLPTGKGFSVGMWQPIGKKFYLQLYVYSKSQAQAEKVYASLIGSIKTPALAISKPKAPKTMVAKVAPASTATRLAEAEKENSNNMPVVIALACALLATIAVVGAAMFTNPPPGRTENKSSQIDMTTSYHSGGLDAA